jgi:hypothetical protein
VKIQEKTKRWGWGILLSIGLSAGLLSGCMQRTVPLASPTPVSADAQGPLPDLKEVQVSRTNLEISDPAVMGYELIERDLVLRTEVFTNSNDSPVWLWVKPILVGLHFWGKCSSDAAQYQSDPSVVGIDVTGGKVISHEILAGEWGALELEGHETVTLKWVVGGGWSWIPGPYPAPPYSCDEQGPERGWIGFLIEGTVAEQARVSVPGASKADATGSANFLDSSQVVDISDEGESLAERWGVGP